MIELERGNIGSEKGKWKGGKSEGARTALVSCPQCGEICSLSGHEIEQNGTVKPSVVCPTCGFHDYLKLAGWSV